MNDRKIQKLIETFADTPEVYETAMYCLHSNWVTIAAESSSTNSLTEVRNIPPESLLLMNRYSSATVKNEFYLQNYAPINVALVQDHLNAKVLFAFARGIDKGINNGRTLMRDMVAQRFTSITTVIFLHAGFDKAYEFSLQMRTLVGATMEEIKTINENMVVR